MSDSADCVLNHMGCAMKEWFGPSANPPLGGGCDVVRFVAGDSLPIALWNAHSDDCGCGEPFLWVRMTRRYRTERFPQANTVAVPCSASIAISDEIGVARCSVLAAEPSWDDYAREMEISVDDSWRIDSAICRGFALARECGCAVATAIEVTTPAGPQGGVIAWFTTGHVQLG